MNRILVVNDEADLAEMCQMVLERRGHEVETRTSLAGLYDVIDRHPPDVLVLDWILGDETADRALLELRRRGDRSYPILVISGTPSVEDTARRLGAASFLTKPFGAGRFAREVDRLLDGGHPARGDQ